MDTFPWVCLIVLRNNAETDNGRNIQTMKLAELTYFFHAHSSKLVHLFRCNSNSLRLVE